MGAKAPIFFDSYAKAHVIFRLAPAKTKKITNAIKNR